jgi:carbon storage regulator
MLILTRKAGEAILIDGGIRIVVLGTDGSGVRVGIEAPSSVGIVREEVIQRMAEEGANPSTQDPAQPRAPRRTHPPVSRGEAEGKS